MISPLFCMRLVGVIGAFFLITACSNSNNVRQSQKIEKPVFLELERIIRRTSNNKQTYKAALLLPLSAEGEVGNLARSMKNAAQLAVFEFNRDNFILLNYDTGKNSEKTQEAVEKAIADGSQIILGPLFAKSTEIAAERARSIGIPLISFTTKQEVLGKGVYALSYMIQSEIHRIARFALENNMRRFVSIVPHNTFGHLSGNVFRYYIEDAGAELVVTNQYTNNLQSKQNAVRHISRIIEDAKQEGLPIDGIFVPEGGAGVRVLANSLLYSNKSSSAEEDEFNKKYSLFEKARLLGIGTWQDKKVLSEPSLKDAWFSDTANNKEVKFYDKFKKFFNYKPTKLSSLAYDAVSIAIIISNQDGLQDPYSIIEDVNGFRGTHGYFKFLPSGETIRSVDVFEVKRDGRLKVVSHSNTSLY